MLAISGWSGAVSARAWRTDSQQPTIVISAPTSGSSLATTVRQLNLAGQASDNRGVTRITWHNDRGGNGTAAGTAAWSIAGIPLATGTNKVVVKAWDAAGNSARDVLWVTYSAPAPTPAPTPAPAPPPTPTPDPVPTPEPVPTANHAPVISGQPVTAVIAGSSYAFTPRASDVDGSSLEFSVMGAPAWATFNAATGRLSGSPGTGDVGLTEGIVITVSDGLDYASLPAFSINVQQNSSGRATLSWLPPTQRTDGSALTDLAGYRIRYGTNASALNQVIQVNSIGITSYMIEGLTPGTWHFALTAVDTLGLESDASNEVAKLIP